jgi:hypothetical protein
MILITSKLHAWLTPEYCSTIRERLFMHQIQYTTYVAFGTRQIRIPGNRLVMLHISVEQIKKYIYRINVDAPYFVSNTHILQKPMRFEMSIQRSKFSAFPLGYGCDFFRTRPDRP